MIVRTLSLTLLMLAASAQFALALPSCTPTKKVPVTGYPGATNIMPTNNLLLPTGKSLEANAQKLIITGRLLDKECKPIPEATVELWQLNPFGKWDFPDDADLATPLATFSGSGRTVTDSDGYFTFTTGFPGVTTYVKRVKREKITVSRAPRVNLRIKANGFEPFSTVMFFDGDHRNAPDAIYKKLKPEVQTGVTFDMGQQDDNSLLATKEIVLSGKAPYRTY